MHMLPNRESLYIFHGFNMLCYLSAILGAVISDGFWGRYKTILWISLIYTAGTIILAITSIPQLINKLKLWGALIGLLFIAIGTGGIKPCVSTFGADQFTQNHAGQLETYFSLFYFCINFGSLISVILTPIIRSDIQCFNNDCYAAAFGIPSLLMIISVALFLSGSKKYVRVKPDQNIIAVVVKVTFIAIYTRLRSLCNREDRKESHWLDWARGYNQTQTIEDIKALYRVLFLLLPVPVFWTLFDQQGSRWTIQAMELNGNLGPFGVVKPDQMQALNPILVLLFIPIFRTCLYPMCRRFNIIQRPLQKMTVGMILAVMSFIAAGFLQWRMQELSSFADLPSSGCSHLRVINAMPDTSIEIISQQTNFHNDQGLHSYQSTQYHPFYVNAQQNITIRFLMDPSYLNNKGYPHNMSVYSPETELIEGQSYTFVVGLGHNSTVLTRMMRDDSLPEYGVTKVRFIAVNNLEGNRSKLTVNMAGVTVNLTAMEPSTYHPISYGSHVILIDGIISGILSFKSSSINTILISFNDQTGKAELHVFGDVEPRPLSILWQIPQYVLITAGEILFSVTGMDFAYASSPASMKSCTTAAWLLTVSAGNFIVIVFEGFKITDNMAIDLFGFAGLLAITTIIFAIMAYYYIPYNLNPNPTNLNEISLQTPTASDSALQKYDPSPQDTSQLS